MSKFDATEWWITHGHAIGCQNDDDSIVPADLDALCDAAIAAQRAEAAAPKELVDLLLASKRDHLECEDCWYSCSQHPECCDDTRSGKPCDCGADAWNFRVDEALSPYMNSPRR